VLSEILAVLGVVVTLGCLQCISTERLLLLQDVVVKFIRHAFY